MSKQLVSMLAAAKALNVSVSYLERYIQEGWSE